MKTAAPRPDRQFLWRAGVGALYVLGLLTGAWGVMGAGHPAAPELLFGDKGDGFFNLWILEHLFLSCTTAARGLYDSGVFWPEGTRSLWWSDNLLVLSPPYLLARFSGASRLAAGFGTMQLFAGAMYLASGWLLTELLRSAQVTRRFPVWAEILPPLVAFPMAYGLARVASYSHMQNVAAVFLLTLVACGVRAERELSRSALFGMAGSFVALLGSSPYQAQMGLVLLLGWGLIITADAKVTPARLLRAAWLTGLLVAPFVLALVIAYQGVEPIAHPPSEVKHLSLRWANLWRPPGGLPGPLSEIPWLRGAAEVEKVGGYLGLGLLILLVTVTGGVLPVVVRRIRAQPQWLLPLTLVAVTFLDIRELRPVAAGLRWLAIGITAAILWRRGRCSGSAQERVGVFPLLCAWVVFGVAFGPSRGFLVTGQDPGLWGFFAVWVPNFDSMRELIRFASTAQALLIAGLFGVALRAGARRRAWWGVGAMCWVLQTGELFHGKPPLTPVGPGSALTATEEHFFRDHATQMGPLWVQPAHPFHVNARHLYRWQPVTELRLINGYSGRPSASLARLMEVEAGAGTGSETVLTEAAAAGAGWACMEKSAMPEARRERVRARFPVLLENDRWLVVDLGGASKSSRH